MKKFMLLIGIVISLFCVSAHADTTTSRFEVRTTHDISASKLGTRAPMRLPLIDAIYDSSTMSIEIVCDTDCDATVFVYDNHGNVIGMSDSLYDMIYVPNTIGSVFFIRIESDNWYGTAEIRR
jgi:hypothetical protein